MSPYAWVRYWPGSQARTWWTLGLLGFSEAAMLDLRYDNIRVSYLMPGSVDTGFGGPAPAEESGDSWKIAPADIAQVVVDLLDQPARTLPSRVEIRPSRPRK